MDSIIDEGPDLMDLEDISLPGAGRNRQAPFQTGEERVDQLEINAIDRQNESVEDPSLDIPGASVDNPNTDSKLIDVDGLDN